MPISLEALVIELIKTAMLEQVKLTFSGLVRMVENNSEYDGKIKGKSLERRIRSILQDEQILQQIREVPIPEKNNISAGFKIGRLEIKGRLDLSKD